LPTCSIKTQSPQGYIALITEQTFLEKGNLNLVLLIILPKVFRDVLPGIPEIKSGDIIDKIAILCIHPVQDCGDLSILDKDIMEDIASMN
jgi:hypothetical protein